MNKKTSINSIYSNLWAPTAGLLQGLTVMQECAYQMKFRNVSSSKQLVQPGFFLEQNNIDIAVNEWRKRLLACVCIVGQHFKQFYCRQLINGQLNKM